MKWTVTYRPTAESILAELWNVGPDRAEVTAAANRIDWLLRHHPLDAGEAREDNERILVERPLAVSYTVSEPDLMVSVFDVWRWSEPPQAE
jgi:hypothetical protein